MFVILAAGLAPACSGGAHGNDAPQQGPDHRLRPRRLFRSDLRRARQSGANHGAGPGARRPAHHHHRRRELSRLRRHRPGAVADGTDGGPGASCGHAADPRHGGRRGLQQTPLRLRRRFRRFLCRRHRHRLHRRTGEVAGPRKRAALHGLRRFGLCHLRWLLLPRQGGRGDRRRQHRRGRRRSTSPTTPAGSPSSTAATRSAPRRFCRTACSATTRSRSCGTTSWPRSKARAIRRR